MLCVWLYRHGCATSLTCFTICLVSLNQQLMNIPSLQPIIIKALSPCWLELVSSCSDDQRHDLYPLAAMLIKCDGKSEGKATSSAAFDMWARPVLQKPLQDMEKWMQVGKSYDPCLCAKLTPLLVPTGLSSWLRVTVLQRLRC